MPRSFSLSNIGSLTSVVRGADWSEPRVYVRGIVGLLVLANLLAAAFAFHLFGTSPAQLRDELADTQASVAAQRLQLVRKRQISVKIGKAKGEGDQFLSLYMTPRRTTYSTIVSEIQKAAQSTDLTLKENTIAPLEPVKGSDDLSMMTITASFEGNYPNLLKFINLLDRSPRFLIIESLAASPQASGKGLLTVLKLNTFVRGDTGSEI